jgi:hypothetical protein
MKEPSQWSRAGDRPHQNKHSHGLAGETHLDCSHGLDGKAKPSIGCRSEEPLRKK